MIILLIFTSFMVSEEGIQTGGVQIIIKLASLVYWLRNNLLERATGQKKV